MPARDAVPGSRTTRPFGGARVVTRPGINVIGHVGGNLGVGVVTRQVIALLLQREHPVAAFDVDRQGRPDRDTTYDRLVHTRSDDLPHAINLFVLGLGAVDWALALCPDRFFEGRHLNAVICFWELPVLPAARAAQLDGFDVVIAASDYMRHVFQQTLKRATVVQATLPVTIPRPVPFDRAQHGIDPSAPVFGFSFDPTSDIERKNPGAVIAAFQRGVGDTDAWLILRVNNAHHPDGSLRPPVDALRRVAGDHPRILMLTQPMSYAEVLGLYRTFDVYVSLHRAEGLGLGMAEAMTLGIPVIATGWSGNMTYMRPNNAGLVDYALVPVAPTHRAYHEDNLVGDTLWAEPDQEQAAAMMRALWSDADMRRALGRSASAAMAAFNANAREGAFVDDLLALVDRRAALEAVGYRPRTATVGRPTLSRPSLPLAQRLLHGSVGFSRRVLRKMTKVAGAAPARQAGRSS